MLCSLHSSLQWALLIFPKELLKEHLLVSLSLLLQQVLVPLQQVLLLVALQQVLVLEALQQL
jgi:hypothetical protein